MKGITMKTAQYTLVSALTVAVSLCLPSLARSENLALVLSNGSYVTHGDARRVVDRPALVALFENAGFRVLGAENVSGAALRDAAAELHDAAAGGDVDRVAIVLSGHFVTGTRDTWLLGGDAPEVSALSAGAAGLPVSALSEIAAAFPGQAVVVLVPSDSDDLVTGFGVSPGIGRLEVPQGVTVVQGPSNAVQDWIGETLLTPGVSLLDAAQDAPRGVQVTGFMSDRINFVDAPVATVPQQAEADGAEGADGAQAAAELSFWNATRDVGTAEAFARYLQRYPQGRFAADAQARIAELRASPQQQAEAREAELALDREARRNVQRDLSLLGFDPAGIDGVFGPGSRAAISAHQQSLGLPDTGFLSAEQLQTLRRDAAVRADELERQAQERRELQEAEDRAYWDGIGRGEDEAGLRAYLQRYPDGVFSELARQRLNGIDEDRRTEAAGEERSAWDQTREQDTVGAYQRFLENFPDGSFAEAAGGRLAELQADDGNRAAIDAARAEESRVIGNQVARLLVEQRLDQSGLEPGNVDGSFDDDTRRAIRRFQQSANLPVTGYVTQATMVRLLASGLFR